MLLLVAAFVWITDTLKQQTKPAGLDWSVVKQKARETCIPICAPPLGILFVCLENVQCPATGWRAHGGLLGC